VIGLSNFGSCSRSGSSSNGGRRRTDRDPTLHSTHSIVETWTAVNCVYMALHNLGIEDVGRNFVRATIHDSMPHAKALGNNCWCMSVKTAHHYCSYRVVIHSWDALQHLLVRCKSKVSPLNPTVHIV